VYTLIVHPDNTYEVRIDGKEKASGSLFDDWDMLPAKMIKDPEQSKPDDWVDEAMIDDPEDSKPEGWDDIPEYIVDPDAEKPEDWDDDMDGEWEAPEIDNPEFKGEWKPKRIPNPEYQGKWVHPEIENPEYVEDTELYLFENLKNVGFDLWQVKSGTIFDNIIVTDDIKEAEAFMAETFDHDAEKKAFDEMEAAKRAEEEDDDDDDDDDDDEEEEDDSEEDTEEDDDNAKDEL
jgi:calreticulin